MNSQFMLTAAPVAAPEAIMLTKNHESGESVSSCSCDMEVVALYF